MSNASWLKLSLQLSLNFLISQPSLINNNFPTSRPFHKITHYLARSNFLWSRSFWKGFIENHLSKYTVPTKIRLAGTSVRRLEGNQVLARKVRDVDQFESSSPNGTETNKPWQISVVGSRMTGGGGRTGTRERVPLNLYRLARVAFRVQVTRYNPVAGRVFPSCSGKSITWPAVELSERKADDTRTCISVIWLGGVLMLIDGDD